MQPSPDEPVTPPASLLDAVVRILRLLGLLGFLGGLLALAMLSLFGPRPQNAEQWGLMLQATRAIFFPCVFVGIVVLVFAGSALWWRHRRVLHGRRWFRLMMLCLLITVPASHLWARWNMIRLRDAVQHADLERAAAQWDQMAVAYIVSFIVMAAVAAIGILKPALGQARNSPPH
jgi:hypothetical protein